MTGAAGGESGRRAASVPAGRLGWPRVHLRRTDSTSDRARALALAGAPHGTLVTAGEQTAGRGRQGRRWSGPAGSSLLMSVVVRDPPELLPLAVGVAVAEAVGPAAQIKWPNDVLVDGRKVAGILVEGRPLDGWSVVGIGVNVAVAVADLPAELRDRAGTLGLGVAAIEPMLAAVLAGLGRWLAASGSEVLAAWAGRDALRGRRVQWADGRGTGAGIDGEGRLVVALDGGGQVALLAGEVHLVG